MSAVPTNIKPLPNPLEALVDQWVAVKKEEDLAKLQRIALEDRILALVPAREEGSDTTPLSNGFKVTTTGKLSYKADDLDAIEAVCKTWGEHAGAAPIKIERKLDETGAKWLRANKPELWKQIAPHITVTPAKTSISVKV